MWTAFVVLKNAKKADEAKHLAITSYRIVVGEDETLEETYGQKAMS